MALHWIILVWALGIPGMAVGNIANSPNDIFMCMKVGQLVAGTCPDTDRRLTALEEQVKNLQNQTNSGVADDSKRNISVPKDCQELLEHGYTANGEYTISPDGRYPFSVYCDLTDGGWTVIQRRFDGHINFRRNWEDYVGGFGNLSGEHWLGLDNIYRLTKDSSEIYFEMQHSTNDRWVRAHYKAFKVHDASSRYRMNVDSYGYESDFGDGLSYHDGQIFSTIDRDNDSKCVEAVGGGGWWFKACFQLGGLNALYGKQGVAGMGYYTNTAINIKASTVKVKPRYPPQ